MKKSLLALAAISFAGAAAAQSSVTLFGIVDAAYAHVSAGGRSASGITNSGINSSRLGFRGTEDMGGGLKANFWLEGQLNNDVGQGGSQTTGLDFRRRAYVGLEGGFGTVNLGREYTPTFWNTTVYDPFGTNGVGQSMTPAMIGASGAVNNSANAVRADNMISYTTPGMGGFIVQAMVAMGENTGGVKTNNYVGFRVGYAAGPLSVHFANGSTKAAVSSANTKYNNIGASYDLGAVKPIFFYGSEKASGAKVTGMLIGATAPMGQGEFRAAYSTYNVSGTLLNNANDWKKFALGYVYNLSKRTAMYGTYARVSNSGAQNRSVSNNGLSAGAAAAGGASTGYEFGVRHVF